MATSSPNSPVPTASPQRFVCIHGHFYQPPRENPWLETVELQESAAPYHDWNERITSECYAPNGASRITDTSNHIIRILNNYARISFNFGPTLLSWLESKARRTYRMILEADAASARRYGGHGSALAQVYSHIIMPLASERDARTQIRWGIADFEYRFGRKPEGMWLAETAVNRQVLDLMAQEGILFTILAPNQCKHVRRIPESKENDVILSGALSEPQASRTGGVEGPAVGIASSSSHHAQPWTPTPDASVDPTHPYRIPLNDGRSIAVFFYDGPGSRAIAFEGLLNSGETFGKRLLGGFRPHSPGPQLSHVATDGESYGHHHKHGEMALSYAMHWIEESGGAQLTNYGEFLERLPARLGSRGRTRTAPGAAPTASERWSARTAAATMRQTRTGTRSLARSRSAEAFDRPSSDRSSTHLFGRPAGRECFLNDPWAARDGYIDVVLDRTPAKVEQLPGGPRPPTRLSTRARAATAVSELLEIAARRPC